MQETESVSSNSDIFREYAEMFINSGETPENIMAFSAIAITAWNYANETEQTLQTIIDNLEKRLKKQTISNFGNEKTIKSLVLEHITRKKQNWNEHIFKINSARFEQENGLLKVIVN